MPGERFSQIKELQVENNRTDIEISVMDLNLEYLNKNEEIINLIEKYVEEFIGSDIFSMSFVEDLLSKLSLYKGIHLQTDISISSMLYNLVINVVLLPNYLENNQSEENYHELKRIINSYLYTLDRKIEQMNKENYCLEIGSSTALTIEMNKNDAANGDILDFRSFPIGDGFGNNIFMYDEKIGGYVFKIPIDLTSKRNKSKRALKPERIKKVVSEIIYEYNKKYPQKRINIFFNQEDNQGGIYNEYIDDEAKFLVFAFSKATTIKNPKEMFQFLTTLIQLNNHIINETAKVFGFKLNKQITLFSSGKTITIKKVIHDSEGEIIDDSNKGPSLSQEKTGKIDFNLLRIPGNNRVTLKDVGGQKKAKEQIEILIDYLKREEFFKSLGGKLSKGIVLKGPSGTGKTLLVRVIANEIDADVYNIKNTDIQSNGTINTGAIGISELFKFLRAKRKTSKKKIVVIFDEMDSLFSKRGASINSSAEDTKVVNTFLSEQNGMDDLENVIFVGTTNRIDAIDPAILRRFENEVDVPLPDLEGLIETYEIYINKLPEIGKKLFSEVDLKDIAKKTIGLAQSAVEDIIKETLKNS